MNDSLHFLNKNDQINSHQTNDQKISTKTPIAVKLKKNEKSMRRGSNQTRQTAQDHRIHQLPVRVNVGR